MPYIKRTVKTHGAEFCYKYHSSRYGKKNGKSAKKAPTTEQQKRINKKIQAQQRVWTICEHFRRTDYYITFTYRRNERPEDMNTAVKCLGKAMAKLSRTLKRKGIKLSYMTVTERGERGAVHHHVLIKNNFDIGLLFSKKVWSHGKIQLESIYTLTVLQLAKYFVKGDSDKSEKKYTQTRDITIPPQKKEIIKAERWTDKPKAPKGYDVIDVFDGMTDFGCPYQEYTVVKRE